MLFLKEKIKLDTISLDDLFAVFMLEIIPISSRKGPMSETQTDLFEHDEIDPSVLEHTSGLPRENQRWPSLLLELRGVLASELKDKVEDEDAVSLQLALAVGEHIGGMQVYLPRGDQLRRQLRNIEIYDKFSGNNIKQLAREYHVSDKTIYEIIAKMRALESQRRQPSLF